jgi:Lipocalin-like domain
MKKIASIIILLLAVSSVTVAQSVKENITKKWKVTGLEEFGTKYDIGENRKNDWLEFKEDGTFTGLIYNGNVKGKWSPSGSKVSMSANKSTSKTKINWIKVASLTKNELVFTYQDSELIQSTLTFSPSE